MSDFDETYHLEAESQEAGVGLLRAAEAKGVVLAPENGWVTIVPEDGQPTGILPRFSEGVLLHILNADDRGWMFELFVDGIPTSSYLCRWDGDLVIDESRLDVDVLVDLTSRRGKDPMAARRALEWILHPTEQYIFDDEDAENPAYVFAELFGISGSSLVPREATALVTSGVRVA